MLKFRPRSRVNVTGLTVDMDDVELEARGLEIQSAAALCVRGCRHVQFVTEILKRVSVAAKVLEDPLHQRNSDVRTADAWRQTADNTLKESVWSSVLMIKPEDAASEAGFKRPGNALLVIL